MICDVINVFLYIFVNYIVKTKKKVNHILYTAIIIINDENNKTPTDNNKVIFDKINK